MIHTHNVAAEIIECFEDVLNKCGIMIPDEDRNGDESEACIYGTTYYNLLEDVESILIDLLTKAKVDFIPDEFE